MPPSVSTRSAPPRTMPRKTPDLVSVADLEGVPETLLMTLYNRAVESRRPNPILVDRKAEKMVARIDYDFTKFGEGRITHPIRASVMDEWLQRFLDRYPNGTVVNLGVGLGTQSARLDNGTATWIDLDVPEVIALRRRFFEEGTRHRMLAASAFDAAWMEDLDAEAPTFFVAAGLLMFFEPEEVRQLFVRLADRFRTAAFAFDVIPERLSEQALAGEAEFGGFTMPPMPWHLDYDRIYELETWHPRLEVVARRDYTEGFRMRWRLLGLLSLIEPLRDLYMGTLVHVRLRDTDQAPSSASQS
ncbi:MAG: class I SAM-dependent methyltransferase [Bacteroidota bacterium]